MLCFRTLLLVYRCFLCMASIKFSKVYLPLMFTTLCNKKLIWKWSDIDADFSIYYKLHCVKSVQIRSNFWSIFSCIQTEYRKIRTRNYSAFGHFSRSVRYSKIIKFYDDLNISFFWMNNRVSLEILENLKFNPLYASVALIQKPANSLAVQINWLVSIWGQHWHLMG